MNTRAVTASDVEALLRAYSLTARGVPTPSAAFALPAVVAGYFWPDDVDVARDARGRAPFGVIQGRILREIKAARLPSTHIAVVERYHGISSASWHEQSEDRKVSMSRCIPGPGSPGSRARVKWLRAVRQKAYEILAQTLTPRPSSVVTEVTRAGDPTSAPWFVELELPLRLRERVIATAVADANRWCAIGGEHERSLHDDISRWVEHNRTGRWSGPRTPGRRGRAHAVVGLALWRVVSHPGVISALRQSMAWTFEAFPPQEDDRAAGPSLTRLTAPPGYLTESLAAKPDPAAPIALAEWVERALEQGERPVGEFELLERTARGVFARASFSPDQVTSIAATIATGAAHFDEFAWIADRWRHRWLAAGNEHPFWVKTVVSTSVALAGQRNFDYAERILVDAQERSIQMSPYRGSAIIIDHEVERIEANEQLVVGRAAWRRRAIQRALQGGTPSRDLSMLVKEAVELGANATVHVLAAMRMRRAGRMGWVDVHWLLGALLRILEPVAIVLASARPPRAEVMLDADERRSLQDVVNQFAHLCRDAGSIAQDESASTTARARAGLVLDLLDAVCDGGGCADVSLRRRLWGGQSAA